MRIEIEIPVIFEDPSILVVNKPAGALTIRDGYFPDKPYLVRQLTLQFGPLWTVHRLDKETSGVLIFARSAEAHKRLNTQFEVRSTTKRYHLLAYGDINWQLQEVDLPLKVDGDRRHRTIVDADNGKTAHTRFQVLESLNLSVCLLEARPKTGYTHQIRAHTSAIGLQIINDHLYKAQLNITANVDGRNLPSHSFTFLPINRIALHAYSLQITHPVTNEPVIFTAPYPKDFLESLLILRNQ